ncbi:Gfo/Idh/MocA family oxidoreductase [Paracoccus sp. R12_1]|uniref:Gfo/Idh/MocA family protein n=1 Tax=unclassified Paracoccus (in: a-proteobacteria) TaxID=2688777 RepID=UPI001ADA6236|nr:MULTISPECIES: Gfo/Idh/MocA family oxidoreductase [unclassified Paracoccus (in: a-proteobacteria)]MBO9456933.1 Gfo/Idh/MocA family oxidoreductase [Paracoccus sp. R12_2]MBO9488026.1 Gfo/Idh/MocA family oxidoreductase [Paracoccus sp. R12_1]
MSDTQNPAGAFPVPRRKLRLGVVGGGSGAFIGQVHARGARLSDRWQIVAGALSSRAEVAKASGRDWGLDPDRSYTDWREMAPTEAARPDGIDAVAITVPNHLHFSVAMEFMDAGIDVISDKPLVNTLDEAQALIEKQRQTGLIFGVTYSFAAHSMVRQARQMVRDGAIGNITQIHVEYFQEMALLPADAAWSGTPWRQDPAKVGGAATTADIGTHAHHLAEFVSGLRMTELRAEFHRLGADQPLEDTAFMNCRFENGVPGTLLISQAAAGASCALRIRISGTKGTLEWDQENPEYLHHRPFHSPHVRFSRGHGAGILSDAARFVHMPRGHPEALSDAWGNLYEEFAIAVEARRDGRELPKGLLGYPGLQEGATGVAFVQAAIRSNAKGGEWVSCTFDK